MILTLQPTGSRTGLSLLEVLVSLAIFLLSFIAIGRLITLSTDQALDIQQRSQAAQLCQSKLAEVVVGAVPMQVQENTPFDEDSSWQWSLDCQPGNTNGLYHVTVSVSRASGAVGEDGTPAAFTLTQMVFDPALRGSVFDSQAATQGSMNASSPPASP